MSGLPALELGAISKVQATDVNAPAADKLSVYDYVVKMLEVLDTRSTRRTGTCSVSPRMRSLLLRDEKFIDALQHCGCSVVASDQIGSILGLPIVVVNALSNHTRPSSPSSRRATKSSRAATFSWA